MIKTAERTRQQLVIIFRTRLYSRKFYTYIIISKTMHSFATGSFFEKYFSIPSNMPLIEIMNLTCRKF